LVTGAAVGGRSIRFAFGLPPGPLEGRPKRVAARRGRRPPGL